MEVQQLQKRIIEFLNKWDEKRGVQPSEEQTVMHLTEEIGELASQYVSKFSRPRRYNEKELENAIGDILIQLIKLAHLRGLDIEKVVTDIFEEEADVLKN